MILDENYTLYNGVEIPKIGLGTWQVPDADATAATKTAIKLGYRHIDTAAAYENERGVGLGIAESGVKRSEILITSKVPAEIKTYSGAKNSIENSLEYLETDCIDLMLIHAPKPWREMHAGGKIRYFAENVEVWKALEEGYKAGKLRAIGVSNFQIDDIENITSHAEIKPMVNQIKVHVGHTPVELIEYCQKHDILVTAYSPNATGRLIGNKQVAAIAEKYGVSVPQLCIRYCLQLGLQVIPKTTHDRYMKQNVALDFTISDADMKTLLQIKEI